MSMCKDIYEICEYVITESNSNIQINTNGAMRDEEFWWNLGVLSRNLQSKRQVFDNERRIRIVFDVDGINQEMHAHYRRKTDFEKLKSNIISYTSAGGEASAHVIVFKHNENYVQDIIDMCKNELGVDEVIVNPSNRFEETSRFNFIDENGKESVLEEYENKDNLLITELDIAPLRDHNWQKKTKWKSPNWKKRK